MAAIEGTDVTIGEFMRTAIHDRLHDVEVAQARCAFEAEDKVVISGIVDMAVLDAYCVERTQAMLNGDD